MANKVYTIALQQPSVLAAGFNVFNFQIQNSNRRYSIKSISFDIDIFETVSKLPLPLSQNTTQWIELAIFCLPPVQFAQSFASVTVPAGAILSNGNQIRIYKPCQLFYDSFFISNNLVGVFSYYNYDAVKAYAYGLSISIEIEDEKLKFAK